MPIPIGISMAIDITGDNDAANTNSDGTRIIIEMTAVRLAPALSAMKPPTSELKAATA